MVKVSRLLPSYKDSDAEHKILSPSLSCVSYAAVLTSCMFAAAHVPGTLANLLRDLQAGCEVTELEKMAALHDYVEKYVCAYIRSLAVACQWAISCLLPCRQDTAVEHGPCWGVLGIHALGPRCHCSTAQTRNLGTTRKKKGLCQHGQNLAKSPFSGIAPLFQSNCCPQGLVWFQTSYFQELTGFTIDSVSQTC